MRIFSFWILLFLLGASPLLAERVTSGLVAGYDFRETEGDRIQDRAGGKGIDLIITDMSGVERRSGSIRVTKPTLMIDTDPSRKLVDEIKRSGEITIEVWLHPEDLTLEGPSRIVTFSKNSSHRNFTVGQEKTQYDVRFRSTKTSNNGIPSLSPDKGSVKTELTHLIYAFSRDGKARLYINGALAKEREIGGATSSWDDETRLALVNEVDGNRPWLGELYLVAIYNRALRKDEIQRNFAAGEQALVEPDVSTMKLSFFDEKIAPIFADHCLECHDTATRKGKLDLSKRAATLAREHVLIPGDPDASDLWLDVESDEMPEDREPLSAEEKVLLKQWIADGAKWPDASAEIDPVLFTHGAEAKGSHWIQRLTIPEYIATVKRTTGIDISREAHELLPPDMRADGFNNTAYNLGVDLKHVESYARLAETIVERMDIAKWKAEYIGKKRKMGQEDHRRDLVKDLGRWLLRGPLVEREVFSFAGIATEVRMAEGSDEEILKLVIEAMLQSPRFMYRIEDQSGDGSLVPVGAYELATRLSYVLQGTAPDKALLELAGAGRIFDRSVQAKEVDRLLSDSRAEAQSMEFLNQWLNLGRLDNLRPAPEKFPDWKPELADDMRAETERFFREIVWKQKRPLADLLNAQETWVSPELAAHYAMVISPGEGGHYDLEKDPARGGLLTQGSLLTIGGDEASMVSRGLFVMHDLLRGVVRDPPPCVDTTPVPTKPGLTQRGIAMERLADKSCGGCHQKFEPLAFGLERFDGLGTYSEVDHFGNPLRSDGDVLIPGTADAVTYETSGELMNLLAESDRVRESLTWKIAQFALGRPLTLVDATTVRAVHAEAQESGGTWQATMRALVMSDLVQKKRTERSELTE